ncbi:MAG TPA: metalloprotease TldD, partial [Candidatus Saccharimonadia bacterium]|nr:metalloprotease TldD [Candidatus Saccharimonadia bacterium]
MPEYLTLAAKRLLEPGGLASGDLERVFGQLMGRGIDRADLYFQHSRYESWSLEDGIVKDGTHSIEQGVGVRALSGEKAGFAYTDEIAMPQLVEASHAARAIARDGREHPAHALATRSSHRLYDPIDPIESLGSEAKVKLLREVDAYARSLDPRIHQVMVSISGALDTVLIATSDGTLVGDVRPLVRFNVQVIVESGGRREQGSAGGGGRYSYGELLATDRAFGFAREAARQALVNLEAIDAPAGSATVVLGPGWPGVLLHEAIGHGLEGDFNRKGLSAFSGRVGERVASPLVTVVDDGTLPKRRGSLSVDDEGTPTQVTTLIENGVLKGYMQDTLNARLTGVASTGNGRRESFAHLTMPRMTNTYMRPGPHDPGEILASVKRGIYAVNFGGGQVDITNGKFVFSASEAYLIENGKVTRPVKGATLIENGVLKGYMQDTLNARLMGVAPTGNGRRESFAHLTMPRMTNTYMQPGPH